MNSEILLLIANNPKTFVQKLKREYPDFLKTIENVPGKTISEKLYRHLVQDGKCSCGKDLLFVSFTVGYRNTCGDKICSNAVRLQHCKETNIERYGVEYPFQNPTINAKAQQSLDEKKTPEWEEARQKKRQDTCMKKYGIPHCNDETTLAKIRDTNNKRYGGNSPACSPVVMEKIRSTTMEHYGVPNPGMSDVIKEKIKKTHLSRYGVHFSQTQEWRDKVEKTSLDRYGEIHPSKSPLIKSKKVTISLQKYGETSPNKIAEYRSKMSVRMKELLQDKSIVAKRTQTKLVNGLARVQEEYSVKLLSDTYMGIFEEHRWLCSCGNEFTGKVYQGTLKCRSCSPGRSKAESEIADFLDELGVKYEMNNRTIISPYELDFVVGDIAIEFCGLYWHSESSGRDRKYHANKLKLCREKGIRLVTIFEDEWKSGEICRERLRHILGKGLRVCSARQTTIKEISTDQYKSFITKYHIQGYVASGVKLGAFHNNQLVAVMSFGKRRKALGGKSAPDEWELLRFATSGNIPGMASKLFRHFLKTHNPTSVVSYCDLRWGTGDVYRQMGFTYQHTSAPNYWYMKNYQVREYRFKYRKDILVKEGYDANKTEWEIMKERGYDRIWDCGCSVWKWEK